MKFKPLVFTIAAIFAVQVIGTVLFFATNTIAKQDVVLINDIMQDCHENFGDFEKIDDSYGYDFVVIDNDEKVLFVTTEGLSNNISDAIKNRDTILDIVIKDQLVGKLIVSNNQSAAVKAHNRRFVVFTSVMLSVSGMILVLYIFYINRRVIKPFNSLTKFATAVSSGNLDTQLTMDRRNIFGAFTESFDIMRTELKNARLAEQKANESKKSLIANLSHDIKTPVASIKALAEVWEVKADEEYKQSYAMINKKADQVNALINNLFSATLEDMEQLPINKGDFASSDLADMMATSDHLCKVKSFKIPEMLLHFDSQRFQQVIDNVISNSYKYANTDIEISFEEKGRYLRMTIKDFGGYKNNPEALLTKFYRGDNADGKDGTGLGLYISKYLMTAMDGDLALECGENFFSVILDIKIS